MSELKQGPGRAFAWVGVMSLLCVLGGCVEDGPNASVTAANARSPRLAARPGVSPRAASVAFTSFDGLPGSYAQRFTAALNAQAAGRDISVTDAQAATYLVRGYLDVSGGEGGAIVTYVWDVFDRRGRRAQRVEDSIALGSSTADPWSLVDDRVLQSIASRSADDLAAFLTNTPEAMGAGAVALGTGSASSSALAYAPE
jgi:hypothetical protein